MKCWCGGETKDSFKVDYLECKDCGTFISIKQINPVDFYNFDYYWHERQVKEYGFPSIEQRAKDDFGNRIPFWGMLLKRISKAKSILEIGGCHGGFLQYCKEHGFERCLGVEISEGTCDFARKTFGLEMICGEFPNVIIDEQFDVVCAFDVLEHLPNPLESLKKMKSLGKYVLIQTPCYRGEREKFTHFNPGEHLFVFNDRALDLLFNMIDLPIIYKGAAYWAQDMIVIGGYES